MFRHHEIDCSECLENLIIGVTTHTLLVLLSLKNYFHAHSYNFLLLWKVILYHAAGACQTLLVDARATEESWEVCAAAWAGFPQSPLLRRVALDPWALSGHWAAFLPRHRRAACVHPPTPGRSCLRCRTQESVLVPASLASSDSSFVAVRYSRLKGLRCWFFHSFATVGRDFLFVTGRKRPAVLTELYCVLSSSSTVSAGRTPSRGERVFVSSVEIKWCQTTQFLP